MKIIILILIFVLTISLYSQNVWEVRLNPGPTPYDGTIEYFEVVDTNNIYFISSSGTPNYLFKSTDNGENWFLYKDLTEYNYFGAQNIEVVDSLMWVGFFGGATQPENGKMLKSTDYGKTFEKIEFPYKGEFSDIIMFDKDNGIANMPLQICKTKDGWKTYDTISFPDIHSSYRVRKLDSVNFISQYATFLNDKYELDDVFIQKYNILDDSYINLPAPVSKKAFNQFYIYNDSTYYFAGKLNTIKGGSGNDVILKSTDAGKTWRTLLDLYGNNVNIAGTFYPFGIQDIAFKNDSVGIAVGQFGKILYTYDGGESWYYEIFLPSKIYNLEPPSMLITYAGDRAIIGDYNGSIFTLEEDKLAPTPKDTLTISGKIFSEDSLAKSCIPVRLSTYPLGSKSDRVTMTDKEGNYKFTKVAPGSYLLVAFNKYYNGDNLNYFFEPYIYSPQYYMLSNIKSDTTGIDFNAINKRGSSMVTGTVSSNGKGLAGIEVLLSGDNLHKDTTNSDGFFTFENIGKWINPYKLSPNNSNYSFAPEYYELYVNENIASQNFEASPTTRVETQSKYQVRANILYSEDVVGMEYRVVSLSGSTLKSDNLPKELDLNPYPTGIYILNIVKGEEIIFTHKFQVVK